MKQLTTDVIGRPSCHEDLRHLKGTRPIPWLVPGGQNAAVTTQLPWEVDGV
jgi:hypothetical protein